MTDAERTLGNDDSGQQAPGAAAPGALPPEEAPGRRDDAATSGGERGNGATADEDALSGDVDELVAVAAERDEYLALAQRTQADFENYRKRVAREAAAASERGAVALAKELLPALDNLERAIDHAAKDDPLLEGVRLVADELAAALARVGIHSYSPAGEPFDPSLHEAVATAPAPEGGPASGTVLEVYQPGYRLGDTVIRPARVVVVA
ncbi:MAG TPA: nucleotide exchange factor GrpE [Solirubrobacteraceae bacterium]|jgi:molecular chaperone GrpE|nr:nucleotide exchange factor GrpE [Solirubrobacteraceae bacterium]